MTGSSQPSPPMESPFLSRRIAMVAETTGPGGLETVLVTLARAFRERGHEVIPIIPLVPGDWLTETFASGDFDVETFALPHGWGSMLGAAREVYGILRRRRIEAVHSHDFTAAVVGGGCARLLGIPSVMTLHGSRYYAERWYRRQLLGWVARGSRAVVAVSGSLKEHVVRDLSLPEHAVHVVQNGVPPAVGERTRGRRELGLHEGEIAILAVGRLTPVKGLDVLLRAVALLGEALPPHRIFLAGEGEARPELEALRDELGLERSVTLLGMRGDIPDLMAGSDIFTMPSRSEGLPVALLEAMGVGLPIVASRVGGIPELLDDGKEGVLVQPEDPAALAGALSALMRDPDARERMGQAARARMTYGLSAAGMVDQYERLLCGVA